MLQLYKLEFAKVQWSVIFLLIALDTVINSGLGAMYMESFKEIFSPSWYQLYNQSQSFHTLFFYPLYAGIFASLICYYEHKNNVWKQLLSLPISKSHLYLAKFGMLMTLMALVQIAFFFAYIITGWIIQPPGRIAWGQLTSYAFLGWLSIFPLCALQLWISQKVKGFGKSLVLNISLVLPNLIVTGMVYYIAAWFPFSLPFFAMSPKAGVVHPFDPISFWFIVAFTTLLYLVLGWRIFIRREWG